MKTYFRIVLNVIFLIVSFGYVLPWLVSYPDTLLVLAGLAYAVFLVPGVVYYANRSYVQTLFNSIKEKI